MEKKTLKDLYGRTIDVVEASNVEDKEELVAFLEGRVELLAKKATSKKPTKNQVENDGIKANIVDLLEDVDGEGVTCTQITKMYKDTYGVELTLNRVVALVKQLRDANAVVRTEIKKVAYFKLA